MRKIFLHNRQPWVRPTVPPHTFLESFRRVDVKPNSYVTPRLTFSILSLLRGLKFRTLGSLGGSVLKGEKTRLGHICTIMQNVTTIDCTAAGISVPGQKKQVHQQYAYPANVGAVTTMCNAPAPVFTDNISVALCVRLSTRLKESRMMSPLAFQI